MAAGGLYVVCETALAQLHPDETDGLGDRVDTQLPRSQPRHLRPPLQTALLQMAYRSAPLSSLLSYSSEIYFWLVEIARCDNSWGCFGSEIGLVAICADHIVWPHPSDDNYASCIGHMDPRSKLILDTSAEARAHSKQADVLVFPDENVGSRKTADVCVMAAKLAYENPAFVERVVNKIWNMNFVKFFNCWNGTNQLVIPYVSGQQRW